MKKLLKTIPYIIIAVLVGVTAVYASTTTSLTPSGPASNTMYSLTDLYNLASGTVVNENTGAIEGTPSEVALSGKSLSDVYTAISTEIAKLSPSVIKTGTTAFGKVGAVSTSGADLSHMYNGTCDNPLDPDTACNTGTPTPFPGGTQTQGGVDDFNGYNLGGVPPVGRYETTWTTCNVGNNYCGTGDTGANAKDEATGLVWSYLCHDAVDNPDTTEVNEATYGCASWDTETDPAVLAPDLSGVWWNRDTYYTWDNTGTANRSPELDGNGDPLFAYTASQLCSNHAGWYLPHQKQLMQAYIDGAYGNGNLEPQGVERYYWSAATVAVNAGRAWVVGLSDGYTYYDGKLNPNLTVRCVRE